RLAYVCAKAAVVAEDVTDAVASESFSLDAGMVDVLDAVLVVVDIARGVAETISLRCDVIVGVVLIAGQGLAAVVDAGEALERVVDLDACVGTAVRYSDGMACGIIVSDVGDLGLPVSDADDAIEEIVFVLSSGILEVGFGKHIHPVILIGL